VKFHLVTNIHTTLDQVFKAGTVKRERIKLHHTAQCDGHEVPIRKHVTYLIYTYTSVGEERSLLLTSEPPFEKWSSFDFPESLKDLLVLDVAWDIQRNTVVLLMKEPKEVRSVVSSLKPGGPSL